MEGAEPAASDRANIGPLGPRSHTFSSTFPSWAVFSTIAHLTRSGECFSSRAESGRVWMVLVLWPSLILLGPVWCEKMALTVTDYVS